MPNAMTPQGKKKLIEYFKESLLNKPFIMCKRNGLQMLLLATAGEMFETKSMVFHKQDVNGTTTKNYGDRKITYEIKHKHLGAGAYKVWLEEKK